MNPGRPTVWGLRAIQAVTPLTRLAFRPTITGLEHLPQTGPYLLVSNHNAGLGLAEILCIAVLWAEAFGASRPLAGFAHPIGFKIWPISALHHQFGVIPSTYEAANLTLGAGVPVLVFPGGDHETLRPVWQADRVDFNGRLGFLGVARDSKVPVIPLGIRGSHFTAPMLFRARWLAWFLVQPKLLGINRWGVSFLGVLVGVAIGLLPLFWGWKIALIWAWLGTPLQFLPWIPWRVSMRIGPPIDALVADKSSLDRVERVIESLIRL